MTLDGFLTVLGLAAAIYAIVPPVPRLRASLALPVQAPVAAAAFLAVLYFEFFDAFGQPCPELFGKICHSLVLGDGPWKPPEIAFLIVIGWMVMAILIQKFAKPGIGALSGLEKLSEQLLYERRFVELTELLAPQFDFISRVSQGNLPHQRFYKWLSGPTRQEILGRLNHQQRPGHRWVDIARRAVRPVIWLFPTGRRSQERATDILRLVYRSSPLTRFTAKERPYFSLVTLAQRVHFRYTYTDKFFELLIDDSSSALYEEISNNQQLRDADRYYIDPANRLLTFLFEDATIAESLGVWKPLGNRVISRIEGANNDEYGASLNDRALNFEEDQWTDPTRILISFFDIMIREAAHQNIRNHMWLYYMPIIVGKISAIYDLKKPEIEPTDEFPNRASRLLYEIFAAMGDWVSLYKSMSPDSPHRRVPTAFDRDEGSIPGAAAVSIGQALRHVMILDGFTDHFKDYIHEMVARDILAIPPEGDTQAFRSFFVRAIAEGGRGDSDQKYKRQLASSYSRLDHVLKWELSDYAAALGVE